MQTPKSVSFVTCVPGVFPFPFRLARCSLQQLQRGRLTRVSKVLPISVGLFERSIGLEPAPAPATGAGANANLALKFHYHPYAASAGASATAAAAAAISRWESNKKLPSGAHH